MAQKMLKQPKPHTVVAVAAIPKCDMCDKLAAYDGKTQFGPWGNMCVGHFKLFGVGVGLGKGQMYVLAGEVV